MAQRVEHLLQSQRVPAYEQMDERADFDKRRLYLQVGNWQSTLVYPRTQNARNRFDGVLPHLEENMPEGYITLHPSINVLVGTDAKARSLLRNLAASHHAAAFVKGIVDNMRPAEWPPPSGHRSKRGMHRVTRCQISDADKIGKKKGYTCPSSLEHVKTKMLVEISIPQKPWSGAEGGGFVLHEEITRKERLLTIPILRPERVSVTVR
ncbi:hypothetical protein BC827DRAFT_1152353 [Russula dissimulans]|nr:hypothetical protein BC827DRAFT_1152353 [Russula dissimulans]